MRELKEACDAWTGQKNRGQTLTNKLTLIILQVEFLVFFTLTQSSIAEFGSKDRMFYTVMVMLADMSENPQLLPCVRMHSKG